MSAVTNAQFEDWSQSIGRSQKKRVYLDRESARRYAVAAGLTPNDISALGHWAWFFDVVPDSEIGPDGHAKRGAFLPNISLPRRMFASSKIEFHQSLQFEKDAEITIEIADIFRKQGSQGELIFVKIKREITQSGALCNRETQTLVYRDMGAPVNLPVDISPVKEDGDAVWTPNKVNLFRFSSVTFNSHRIHYDEAYTQEEGYPSLVVHGPYTATKLADFAGSFGDLAHFEFRGKAPLFQGQQIILRRKSKELFQALRCDGAVAVEAKVEYK